ncbi:MAG: S9 family peptidase [Chitinophagaceae bacterium]|nr:S9 family peptidase [Chitinophagaceae bacterium]
MEKSWRLKATPDENGGLIGWTSDGKNVLWSEANKTLNSVYLLSVDGKSITEWTKGSKDLLGAVAINSTGSHIALPYRTHQNFQKPISVRWLLFSAKVTNINAAYATKALPKTEVVKWKGADGKEIEGLLTYPINYKAGQKVPFILNVHGGPAGVFSQACVAGNQGAYPLRLLLKLVMQCCVQIQEVQLVTAPNSEWLTGKTGGGKDYQDLMAGVDHVIKMGVADESKMGVMGWSYGGFMSSWIVGHTDRFKVASIGAPVVDLSHQNLTDDIEGFLPSYFKSNPWDDWSKYDAHSPLRFIQNVKTPVMLQHGEADLRVPFSNSVMFYNALRRRNVPVRLLALPRQPHGPQEPRMVLKTMQTNLEWFDKYIGEKKGF